MARVRRLDYSSLKAPTRRADGTLVAEALLTRTGVFTYRNPNGSERREYRPPTQVFDDKSLASFKLVPITDEHPPQMLTSQNARQYAVGAVGENIRRDGNHIAATIAIHDAATIAKMDGGKTQVSCGYDCELDETPGTTPDGERYDAVQTNIVGNHLALVHNARAGAAAAVRMDAAYRADSDSPTRPQPRKDTMNLEQALAALAAANEKIGALTARADTAEKSLNTEKERATKLEAERDGAKTALEKAEKERKDALDGAPTRVRARVALETKATGVVGAKFSRLDGTEVEMAAASDRDIKLAVIKHVENVDCDVDGAGQKRPDLYVDARYDAAIERAVTSDATFRGALDTIETHRADATGATKTAKARQDMIDANRNSWQNPNQIGSAAPTIVK